MGAPPLGAKDALDAYWEAWAREGPEAWDAWLPEIAALADNLGTIFGAPAGSVSLAPNVSLLEAAIASARWISAASATRPSSKNSCSPA